MQLGEVFKFPSNQAVGYVSRPKIHIFLTTTDHHRAPDECVFLFISSGDYGGCLPIEAASHKPFLAYDSFISCSNLVFYPQDYLTAHAGPKVGDIDPALLKKLHGHLAFHDVMPIWQAKVACGALTVVL